jgi:hypothetical protein
MILYKKNYNMGKAKRKINRLRRKKLSQKIRPRIPVPPPGFGMKSKMDYDRKNYKKDLEKILDE